APPRHGDLLAHVTWRDGERDLRVRGPRHRNEVEAAWVVRGEAAIPDDAWPPFHAAREHRVVWRIGVAPGNRGIGDRRAVGAFRGGDQVHDVAGANRRLLDADLDRGNRVRRNRVPALTLHAVEPGCHDRDRHQANV